MKCFCDKCKSELQGNIYKKYYCKLKCGICGYKKEQIFASKRSRVIDLITILIVINLSYTMDLVMKLGLIVLYIIILPVILEVFDKTPVRQEYDIKEVLTYIIVVVLHFFLKGLVEEYEISSIVGGIVIWLPILILFLKKK